jgi:uncharacterized protein YlxW (UPF0749 family)
MPVLSDPVTVAVLALIGTSIVGPFVAWLVSRRSQAATVRRSDVDSLSEIIDRLQTENQRLADRAATLERELATRDEHHRREAAELQRLIAHQAQELHALRMQVDRLRRGLPADGIDA